MSMSSYIEKRMQKLKVTDEDIVKWAKQNGYDSLLPGNISMVRQIYIDANDDEEIEFLDLEMRGTRVAVSEIPDEEWVILRVFMFKIARTTTYDMCPEPGCYSRVKNSECQNRADSHGFVTEPVKGIRHYYRAGDGGERGESTYVIVPAKYAMNGYNFEGVWCDVKGIWNKTLEGFFASLILPINGDDVKTGDIIVPEVKSKSEDEEDEEVVAIPKGLNLSAFTKKSDKQESSRFDMELKNFQQIIPFFNGYRVSQFNTFIESNDIQTPLKDLVEATPGCRIEGEGEDAKVYYEK